MKSPQEGGSRVAIVMNGSPLFTGDAGSGESEIRRWILEHDWLGCYRSFAGTAFLQHGYLHLCLGANQSERAPTTWEGPAH